MNHTVVDWVSAVLGGLLLLAPTAAGAEPGAPVLTRSRAIAMALAQSPLIASVAAGELVARAHRGQARAARRPSLTAVLATGPALRARLVPGTGAASTENMYGDVGLDDLSIVVGGRFELAQPLYTFGKIAERERAAEHELRARRHRWRAPI
jgi:outer membrane protein TolC